MNVFSRPGWILVLVVVAVLWLPRGFTLDRFVTADERLWLTRAGNFYLALSQGDWANTFQRHHPGVTVTWLGLAGYLLTYPDYPQDAPGQFGMIAEEIEPFLRSQGYDPLAILAAGRGVVVALIVLLLTGAFWFAARLLGKQAALLGLLLLALAPFHIAHSRFLHLDGLLSALMLLAVLAWWHHLHSRARAGLIVAILATGLAWLTRSPALFLGPLLALTGFAYAAFAPDRPWTRVLRQGTILAGGALLVVVVLWPALWVDPVGSIRQVLEGAGDYAADGHSKPTFFGGEIHVADPGFFFYPITYLWRTTPVTLLGLLLALGALLLRLPPLHTRPARAVLIGLIFYAVSFMLFMNFGAKKFDRYILPIYPALELVAGAGWVALILGASRQWLDRWSVPLAMAGLIGVQAAFALPTFPYYLSYYNPLLGGAARAPDVMMIGWGEGADQVGRILDALPDAANLTVAAGANPSGPLSYFFRGEFVPLRYSYRADYGVLFLQDRQTQLPTRRVTAYFDALPALHTVEIDGLEYGKIVDLRHAPVPDYMVDWVWREPDTHIEAPVIRLVAHELYSAPVQPGETVRVTFHLLNLGPIPVDLNVVARIVDDQGTELARVEGWPWGAATRHWEQGVIWPDGRDLTIPPDTPPGYYRLEIGFYDPDTLRLLDPYQTKDDLPLPDLVPIDVLRVGELPTHHTQDFDPSIRLGDVALLGAEWNADGQPIEPGDAVAPGATLQPALTWAAQQRLTADSTAFIHVVGPDGTLAAQHDKRPLEGWIPMREWLVDQRVRDEFTLQLPADSAPGEYTLYTGFYDPDNGARLPVRRFDTELGDAFRLGSVHVIDDALIRPAGSPALHNSAFGD